MIYRHRVSRRREYNNNIFSRAGLVLLLLFFFSLSFRSYYYRIPTTMCVTVGFSEFFFFFSNRNSYSGALSCSALERIKGYVYIYSERLRDVDFVKVNNDKYTRATPSSYLHVLSLNNARIPFAHNKRLRIVCERSLTCAHDTVT